MSLGPFAHLLAVFCLVLAPVATAAQQPDAAPEDASPPREAEVEEQPIESTDIAVLRGLDKLTGATVQFEAPVGRDSAFERLRIEVEACQIRGEEQAAFLQIFDKARPEGLDMVFSGWMFASSPALSALDHPRYDVWLQSCKTS